MRRSFKHEGSSLLGAAGDPAALQGNNHICYGKDPLEIAIVHAERAIVKKVLTEAC